MRKSISNWIKKDPVKAFITLLVGAAHCFFILMIVFHPSLHDKRPKQKLVVKTFQSTPKPSLQERKKPSAPAKVAAEKKQSPPPKPKETPAKPQKPAAAEVKPTGKPTAKAKGQTPQAKPAPAKKAPEKSPSKGTSSPNIQVPQELIEELEERIAKIETKRDKIQAKADISVPKSIDSSFSHKYEDIYDEDAVMDEMSTYNEFLVAYLQQQLHLPDFGEVKIEITLRQDGAIERFVVLKTENDKNRKYLEERLPSLRFPEFKGKGLSKNRQTFVLTFCNEI